MGCALNDLVPDASVYEMADAGLLYRAARRHSVVSLVAYALEKAGYEGIPSETAQEFRSARYKAVRKNILLDTEREAILSYMEQEGIRHLPLKGIVLKEFYPGAGMRQMADNDILYDTAYSAKVKGFMEGRGFQAKKHSGTVHQIYYKEPVYNFELHSRLFHEEINKGLYSDYYEDIWDRAIRDDDKRFGYHLSDEDFYVYMTAHAAKHYTGGGTGVRTLADYLVVNRACPGMDREYIDAELGRLELVEFEAGMRELAYKVLSDPGRLLSDFACISDPSSGAPFISDEERAMLGFLLSSGSYGTNERRIINMMKKRGVEGELTRRKKMIYFFKRIFPGQKALLPFYPIARYKVLIPAVWIFRIVRGILCKRKILYNEFDFVRKR